MTCILQIDTSGDESMVAISGDGVLLATVTRADTRDHAAVIHGMTAEALAAAGLAFSDLAAVAVCAGPGSYTGLRIGMAVAKGFCYTLDIPLLLQNKLTLFAYQHIAAHGEAGQQYAVVLSARTGEYFAACYDASLHPVLAPQHMLHQALAAWLQDAGERLRVISGTEIFDDFSAVINSWSAAGAIEPAPWCRLAWQDFREHKTADLAAAEPFYMKEVFINK